MSFLSSFPISSDADQNGLRLGIISHSFCPNGAIIYKMAREEARCEAVSPGAGRSLLTLWVIY